MSVCFACGEAGNGKVNYGLDSLAQARHWRLMI
jgi:hypothetical protein